MKNLPHFKPIDPQWVRCELAQGLGGDVYTRITDGTTLEFIGVVRDLPASNELLRTLVILPANYNIKQIPANAAFVPAATAPASTTANPYLQIDPMTIKADLSSLSGIEISWVIVNGQVPVILN